MKSEFCGGRVILHHDDSLLLLPTFGENTFDSCFTDPPYHLTSNKKGGSGPASDNPRSPAGRARIGTGFMGKKWDGGDIAFKPETWTEVLRVLKPGAHLMAFGAPRTYHRLACAIEDAGFEIRDMVGWLFGQGFPKSLDFAKDHAASKREGHRVILPEFAGTEFEEGFGTGLKPAIEPIVLARKPMSENTVAANVLRWRTGALNIDASRVEVTDTSYARNASGDRGHDGNRKRDMEFGMTAGKAHSLGRWPANVAHDGAPEVEAIFPKEAGGFAPVRGTEPSSPHQSIYNQRDRIATRFIGDSGSAARFFYTAKADAEDRVASDHPTIKPVDLIQYFVRLITPPAGCVLDPFAGTATTGEAAWREGLSAHLIEKEEAHMVDARRRLAMLEMGPASRATELGRASKKAAPDMPLFGSGD